jgi:hypothetical protein
MHTQEHMSLPLSHVGNKSLFQLARRIKEIQKVGQFVRGHQDHWSQETKKDLEAIRPGGIFEVKLVT